MHRLTAVFQCLQDERAVTIMEVATEQRPLLKSLLTQRGTSQQLSMDTVVEDVVESPTVNPLNYAVEGGIQASLQAAILQRQHGVRLQTQAFAFIC